jgi:Ca-activated chloride channel family protein
VARLARKARGASTAFRSSCLLALLAANCGSALAQDHQSPTIQVDVSRVDVGIIVTDTRGNFVEGLTRADFHVFDSGTEQPISDFAAVSEPATLLLILEAGPAVYLLEGGHLNAAYALLQHLAPQDRVALASYADALSPVLNLTTDKQLVASALSDLHFNLGFGSLNLSSSLNQALITLQTIPGKKSIVLLSTGFDTSPATESSLFVQQLRTAGVRIFAVSLNGELRSPEPSSGHKGKRGKPSNDKAMFTEEEFTRADALLSQIADRTGGRAFFPRNGAQFSEAYTQIADLVRHEYSLAFVPPLHDGQLHALTVQVDVPNATPPNANATAAASPYRVSHRQAYIAPQR